MFLTVINFLQRDMVINNGVPFTNITYATRVPKLCNFIYFLVTSMQSITTLSGFCHTVFPLVSARFEPNVVWVLVKSHALIGKFWIMSLLTIDLKSISDEWQIVPWYLWASLAAVVSFLVKPSKLSLTFCMKAASWFFWHQCMLDPFHHFFIRNPHTWCGKFNVHPGCHIRCGTLFLQVMGWWICYQYLLCWTNTQYNQNVPSCWWNWFLYCNSQIASCFLLSRLRKDLHCTYVCTWRSFLGRSW